MNGTLLDGVDDDAVRELLASARADAPAPHEWPDLFERADRSDRQPGGRRRRLALAVAAATVAIGCLGLVAALQFRDDNGGQHPPLDRAPVPDAAVDVGVDPLADLSADDWVVPGSLPDGYEVLVAIGVGDTSPSDARLLVGGDDVAEVTISAPSSDARTDDGAIEEETVTEETVTEETDGEASDAAAPGDIVEVAGVEWEHRAIISDDGITFGHTIQRQVNDRIVVLSTSGDLDALVAIAADLRAVPDDELDVPRLAFDDGTYTTVTTFGDADLTARGVNGVFCLRIDTSDGVSAGGCGSRTEPGSPVVTAMTSGSPAGSFTAGLAEPDVARIEFVHADGDSVVVTPADDSGSFDQRFWLTDGPGVAVGTRTPFDDVIVTYDDGSTVTIRADRHGRWTIEG